MKIVHLVTLNSFDQNKVVVYPVETNCVLFICKRKHEKENSETCLYLLEYVFSHCPCFVWIVHWTQSHVHLWLVKRREQKQLTEKRACKTISPNLPRSLAQLDCLVVFFLLSLSIPCSCHSSRQVTCRDLCRRNVTCLSFSPQAHSFCYCQLFTTFVICL